MDLLLLTAVDPFSYQIIPDLGLMYLAATAREAGMDVVIKDLRKDRWPLERLSEYVSINSPKIIGIKCYSHEIAGIAKMVRALRIVCPQALFLLGGPHASSDPEGALAQTGVDYVFIGEAESSLKAFLAWFRSGLTGLPPESIAGIAFRTSSGMAVRKNEFAPDLDQLPMPAWDLLPPSEYPDEATGIFVPGFPIAPMMLSRGCPFRCAYCGARKVMGERIRYRSPRHILAEIDYLSDRYRISNFSFLDDNYTCNREKAAEMFTVLAARKPRIAFSFPNGVRAETLDAELLKLMERAGCYSLALGIESGSDATLARMRKGQTRLEVEEAVALIRRTTSIRITGFFILGYPGETLEDVEETIRFAHRLPIHHPHFCLFTPLPGTPVYRELQDQGIIPAEGLPPEMLTFDRPQENLPGLPPRKVIKLHQYAYAKFYLKPWRIWNLMREIRSPGNLWVIARRVLKLLGLK